MNYKPLNVCLHDNQHLLLTKGHIWQQIQGPNIYSKFDLTKAFWQIQIKEEDRYKTTFTVPRGLYQLNVSPFGIKTALSLFQHTM